MAEHVAPVDVESSSAPVAFPKPPTPPIVVQAEAEPAVPSVSPVPDPPPPYPSRERRTRAGMTRNVRRLAQITGDSGTGTLSASSSHAHVLSLDTSGYSDGPLSPSTDDGGTETTPLLSPRRRPRTISHSTVMSTQSMAQTVFSLFQTDDVDAEANGIREGSGAQNSITASTTPRRSLKRYFRPLWKSAYYRPLAHLLFINFFYALLAFLYLFVGTLTGTTLLIALPLGAVLCWFNLVGARAFARGEIALQTHFHGPLAFQAPNSKYPIFSRPSNTPSTIEAGQSTTRNQGSFLRNTYAMFRDQTSYQALFYFLVIKPSITLFLTIALYVMVPVAFVLIVPAPAALRAVKRIGVWQANIALEGLLQPRL